MTHGFFLDSCTIDASKAPEVWKAVTHTRSHSQKAGLGSHCTFLNSVALPVPTLVQISSRFNRRDTL